MLMIVLWVYLGYGLIQRPNSPFTILLAVLLVADLAVLVWSRARKRHFLDIIPENYAAKPDWRAPFESVWDETGFQTKSAEFDHSRRWTDFQCWREDPNHIVVIEKVCFRTIPKRMLGGQLETFRTMLIAHLGPAV